MKVIEISSAERAEGGTHQIEAQSLVAERQALGRALIAEFEIDRLKSEREDVIRNGASRRYEVVDRGGVHRPFSELDIRRRARATADRSLLSLPKNPGHLSRRWKHVGTLEQEVGRAVKVLQQLRAARIEDVKGIEERLNRAIAGSQAILDQAASIKHRYEAGGQPIPAPLLTESQLNDLQESAISCGDSERVKMIEEIRERLSSETGFPIRTDQEVGRLRAQLFMVESSLFLRMQSWSRFEETKHIRHWESSDGPSFAEVEQVLAWVSDQLEFHDGRSLDSGDLQRKEVEERIEKNTRLRETILDRIECKRDRIVNHVSRNFELVQTLTKIVGKEEQRYRVQGHEFPSHLFTEKELDELDSHAARQRNPGFYSLLVAFERGLGLSE